MSKSFFRPEVLQKQQQRLAGAVHLTRPVPLVWLTALLLLIVTAAIVYLANAQYPGNSSKASYLLAEPVDLPVIEVAFLNGQESPTIETAEADFNQLGIKMRGYHDFGCAMQDPRGGVKSKGEV